jgi:glycosyltransferase involved in cell wall biosynthesis
VRVPMKALAVVPSFREEEVIADTVTALRNLEQVERVIVVDDASGDLTASRAREAGATVVVNGRNLGKGSSLNRVLAHLRFDVLLLIDGDLGAYASEAALLLRPVNDGQADLSIGSFGALGGRGGFGFAKGLGRAGIKKLTGHVMETPLSGQRAMTAEAFRALWPFAPGFGMEVAMTVDALRAGLRVIEVPVGMSHRETGRDLAGFVHRGKQFADIFLALAKRTTEGRAQACSRC